jgi:hypothetical protein
MIPLLGESDHRSIRRTRFCVHIRIDKIRADPRGQASRSRFRRHRSIRIVDQQNRPGCLRVRDLGRGRGRRRTGHRGSGRRRARRRRLAPGRGGRSLLPGRGGRSLLPGRGGRSLLPGRGGRRLLLRRSGRSLLPGRSGLTLLPGRGGLSLPRRRGGRSFPLRRSRRSLLLRRRGLSLAPRRSGLSLDLRHRRGDGLWRRRYGGGLRRGGGHFRRFGRLRSIGRVRRPSPGARSPRLVRDSVRFARARRRLRLHGVRSRRSLRRSNRRRLNHGRVDRGGTPATPRRTCAVQQHRAGQCRADHPGRDQNKPTDRPRAPPVEARSTRLGPLFDGSADLFRTHNVHQAQKPCFPGRSRVVRCAGRVLIQLRSAIHRVRLAHRAPDPNHRPPSLRVRDRMRAIDAVKFTTSNNDGGRCKHPHRNHAPAAARRRITSRCQGMPRQADPPRSGRMTKVIGTLAVR